MPETDDVGANRSRAAVSIPMAEGAGGLLRHLHD